MTNLFSEYDFIHIFNAMQKKVHDLAKEKGWWSKPVDENSPAKAMMNFHSEISEGWECIRKGTENSSSQHIHEFSNIEEELADIVIRVMDYSEIMNYRLSEAILAKHEFNKTRSHRHGGKKF